jgi:multiple sugar transport system substrate-binding protein/putative aldouronate transport system substrate-binding protein
MPELPYSETARDDTLEVKRRQIIKAITTNSWRAIFAKADGEFDMHIRNMRSQCESYGYDEYVEWSRNEAAIKWQLQQEMNALGD